MKTAWCVLIDALFQQVQVLSGEAPERTVEDTRRAARSAHAQDRATRLGPGHPQSSDGGGRAGNLQLRCSPPGLRFSPLKGHVLGSAFRKLRLLEHRGSSASRTCGTSRQGPRAHAETVTSSVRKRWATFGDVSRMTPIGDEDPHRVSAAGFTETRGSRGLLLLSESPVADFVAWSACLRSLPSRIAGHCPPK